MDEFIEARAPDVFYGDIPNPLRVGYEAGIQQDGGAELVVPGVVLFPRRHARSVQEPLE